MSILKKLKGRKRPKRRGKGKRKKKKTGKLMQPSPKSKIWKINGKKNKRN